MGVLNVTPDSFSDGGCFADTPSAVAHGLAMHAAGADYVDVGGESTRPGADRVDSDEECRRVLPVIRELSGLNGLTTRPPVLLSLLTIAGRSPRHPAGPGPVAAREGGRGAARR